MTAPAAPDEVWTVARVLAWASDDLKKRAASDSPRLDAELLLCRALGIDRVRLIVESQRPLDAAELARFKEMLIRRRRCEPIAYILGEREFYGHRFSVTRDVLIPRPDTEVLVDVALTRTEHLALHGRALDVCTGSGCVAIAFAKERPTWHVTGSDISGAALEIARGNALRLGAILNVDFRQADLFEGLSSDTRFDLISANPPYIPEGDAPTLSPDIRNHEPSAALYGGADGLAIIRRLLEAAPALLAPGGVLAMEVGAGQADRVAKGFARYGFAEVEQAQDYAHIPRVVSGRIPT